MERIPEKPTTNTNRVSPILRCWPPVRRVIVLILGVTVTLAGVVMLFTPGPALVVIPSGVAILATEFLWAKRLLKWVRHKISEFAHRQRDKHRAKRQHREQEESSLIFSERSRDNSRSL